MSNMQLLARPRAETGKNACRRMRAQRRIPAVIYGLNTPPENLTVDDHELLMLLTHEGMSSVIDLQLEGQGAPTPCVIREIVRDPISHFFLHVDLLRVDMSVESEFPVEVVGVGTPVGVREGGILETVTRQVEIRCLPANLPHAIEVDITDLAFNVSLHAGELTLPEGVTLVSDEDTVLFSVMAQRGMEEEEEVIEEVAEPEVMGRKKEDEEESE